MENEKDIWGEIRELLGSCTTPAAEERATRTAGPVEAVIVQGDCVQAMTSLRPESVDLIVTDPPYLCRFKNRRGQTIQNDDRGDWVLPAYVNMYRALKPDSVCVTFCGWNRMEVFLHAWKAAGFWVLEHVVFVKPYDCSSGYVRRRHEQGYVLGKGRPPLPQVVPPSVIEWKYTKNLLHPTQKPIHILRMFIAAYSRKGDCVLDPFCGSGSTLVAARELDRHSIGIELDGTFAEVAKRRLAQPVGTRD